MHETDTSNDCFTQRLIQSGSNYRIDSGQSLAILIGQELFGSQIAGHSQRVPGSRTKEIASSSTQSALLHQSMKKPGSFSEAGFVSCS